NTGWGEFWNGTNRSVTGSLEMRANYHFNVDLSYSRNHVVLPGGAFTTQLVGARIVYGFSPRACVNAFVQYNRDTHQVSASLRCRSITRRSVPRASPPRSGSPRRSPSMGDSTNRCGNRRPC